MNKALIIFVRKPEEGKVKTRLAATIGASAALHIYKRLLAHTFNVSAAVKANKFIFYAGEVVEHDIWTQPGYVKLLQQESHLGNRMQTAFDHVLKQGYKQVIIIGSDCPYLTADDVEKAFTQLEHQDVVIGPAADGGYYLLGMQQLHSSLFINKQWSTNTVFKDTILSLQQAQLSYSVLPTLSDVDEEKDVPPQWLIS